MLSNFGYSYNNSIAPGFDDDLNQNSLVDFAKIFDDEFAKEYFTAGSTTNGSTMETYEPNPSLGMSSAEDALRTQLLNNLAAASEPASAAIAPTMMMPQQPQQPQYQQLQLPGEIQPLVNVIMIVDPVTQKVFCPKQVLSIEVDGKIEKTIFGPTILDSIPKDAISAFSQSVSVPPPTPSQAAQTVFHPISPAPPMQQQQLQQTELVASGKVSPTSSSSDSSVGSSDVPPLRALSAYNFFFRDERDRILNGGDYEWTADKQMRLLAQHWNQDRTKKRRHRKTHGKIDFTTLSKLISKRWKELSEDRKEFYRQVASQDWERYQREINDYKKSAPLSTPAFQAVIG
jgi:hypothetical protein